MSAVLDRIIRDLRRAGDEREARGIELVQALYQDLDLADLIALLRSATETDSPLARVKYMDKLMDAWDDATALLVEPPQGLALAVRQALEVGVTGAAEMLAAQQIVTDAFRVPPTLQLRWMDAAEARMREFWGGEPPRFRSEIQGALRLGLERGQGIDQIVSAMQDRVSVSRSRAVRIARTEIANAASYAMRESQKEAGATHYIWRTAKDQRVRGRPGGYYENSRYDHWARDGKTFAWDKPPPDGHPGEPIMCRCVALPVLTPEGA